MNSSKLNIDEFIHQKVNEANFEMQEEHWQKALHLLNKDEDTKRKFPLWLWSVLVLGLLSISGYLASMAFNANSTKYKTVAKSISNTEVKTESKVVTDSPMLSTYLADKNTVLYVDEKGSVINGDAEKNEKNFNKKSARITSTTKPVKNNIQQKEAQLMATKHDSQENNNLLTNNTTNKKRNFQKPNNTDTANKSVAKVKYRKNKKMPNKNANSLLAINTNTENFKNELSLNTQTEALNYTTSKSKKQKANQQSPRYIKGLDYAERRIDLKNNATLAETIEPKTLEENIAVNKPYENYFGTSDKKGFRIVAGTSASKSMPVYDTAVNQETGWKPSPYIGLAYYYPITNNISFSTWLAFSTQRGLNANHYSYRVKYGFRRDSVNFHLQFKSLYQIQLPVMVQYKINNNHMIGAGLNANFTVATKSRFKDFDVNFYQNSFSYNGAFNGFDLMGIINYQYSISPKMDLFLNYNIGLVDVTNNDFFKNTQSDKSQKIQLGVTYKLNNQ